MQFFYDVSELSQHDHQTGIQRVVRSVLVQLLAHPPQGFSLEPVYARRNEEGYYYARCFTQAFLAVGKNDRQGDTVDAPIDPKRGDIFLRLELQPEVVLRQADFYADLRSIGVKVFMGVHDLLPLWMPQYFPAGTHESHSRWLSRLARVDGVVCVSKTVAAELVSWLNIERPKRLQPLNIGWFHLGADLAASKPSMGLPEQAAQTLAALAARPSFLMVGTIEPRKGHAQTLAAFELLWAQGVDVNLVIVGRHGWHMETFVALLAGHPELGRRLHWANGASDEFLEKIYAGVSCLLAPSEGEGFGLPLIEAAGHGLPIIARGLGVFREVAGLHAHYFTGLAPQALSNAVQQWLALDAQGQAPQSAAMPRQSWRQSTDQLLEVLVGGNWHKHWVPDDVLRWRGSDPRFLSAFGRREHGCIRSVGIAGHLIYGPYVGLVAGRYEVRLSGSFEGPAGPNPNIEVAVNRGERILARVGLYTPALNSDSVRSVFFEADDDCHDVEVRVWVEACNVVTLALVEIHPIAISGTICVPE